MISTNSEIKIYEFGINRENVGTKGNKNTMFETKNTFIKLQDPANCQKLNSDDILLKNPKYPQWLFINSKKDVFANQCKNDSGSNFRDGTEASLIN